MDFLCSNFFKVFWSCSFFHEKFGGFLVTLTIEHALQASLEVDVVAYGGINFFLHARIMCIAEKFCF